jgi:hypothetical protein
MLTILRAGEEIIIYSDLLTLYFPIVGLLFLLTDAFGMGIPVEIPNLRPTAAIGDLKSPKIVAATGVYVDN